MYIMLMQAVGFDMDYTLAQYRPETFEQLAYHLTVDNLVKTFGYPEVSNLFVPSMPMILTERPAPVIQSAQAKSHWGTQIAQLILWYGTE